MKWLAQVDSNHRPRAYQARALTTWAMSQYVAFGSDICSAGEITLWWNPYGWNPHFVPIRFASACLSGGGDDGIRTHDPLLAGQVLSQLSYTPICFINDEWSRFAMRRMLRIHEVFWVFAFSPKDPSKLNNESIYSDKTVILCRIHIVMYGRFSIERRWSSRTFRYGYLVTT